VARRKNGKRNSERNLQISGKIRVLTEIYLEYCSSTKYIKQGRETNGQIRFKGQQGGHNPKTKAQAKGNP
jgi:hypothetical protein